MDFNYPCLECVAASVPGTVHGAVQRAHVFCTAVGAHRWHLCVCVCVVLVMCLRMLFICSIKNHDAVDQAARLRMAMDP